jgi:hypothetical protein
MGLRVTVRAWFGQRFTQEPSPAAQAGPKHKWSRGSKTLPPLSVKTPWGQAVMQVRQFWQALERRTLYLPITFL